MKGNLYGIPLSVAAAGTLASLCIEGKKIHAAFGTVWAGLSFLHGWQHRSSMAKTLQKGVRKLDLLQTLNIPQNKLEVFVRTVEISAYIPGRIRLHSQALIGNDALNRQLHRYLRSFHELSEIKTNLLTGSILICYTPQYLHTNPELTRVENYIRIHVRRR